MSVEQEQLNANIAGLSDQIKGLKFQLGDVYTNMWINRNVDFNMIDRLCQGVYDKIQEQRSAETELAGLIELEKAKTAQKVCACGKANIPGAKFCAQCGSSLETVAG